VLDGSVSPEVACDIIDAQGLRACIKDFIDVM
jgi:hypothetical protein